MSECIEEKMLLKKRVIRCQIQINFHQIDGRQVWHFILSPEIVDFFPNGFSFLIWFREVEVKLKENMLHMKL